MLHADVRPNCNKTLDDLGEEWEGCTKCVLGEQREAVNGNPVFGEGRTRGIMLIAGGPGETEESMGRPFVGASGRKVLRPLMDALGVTDVSYITNLVVCRSCTQQYDGNGQPIFKNVPGKPPIPMWKDEDPPYPCIAACLPRLLEEIYIVDPVIIVALGAAAAETLRGKPIAITRDRGLPEEVQIPGATYKPVRTEKKKVWFRGFDKETGKAILPVTQGTVRYLMIPTVHPAFVARNLTDKRPVPEGPFQCIAADIRLAAKIYEKYKQETEGIAPSGASNTEVDIIDEGDDE